MKVSKIIETMQSRREWLLEQMIGLDKSCGRFHRMNQEQRAIECAIPILEAELRHRHLRVMEQKSELEAA
jgi:hypothetical protein